ncbi:hypothetical protein ACHWQZ_G000517 [Mnemiopsis leidyi]
MNDKIFIFHLSSFYIMRYKFAVLTLFAALTFVEATSAPGHIFNAEKNVDYALNKPLEEGDVIRAWGVYRDHTTSKFSVNIKGQDGINLLHVDFRPWNNVVVLNDYEDGWKTEIRPWFSKYNFSWNTLFEVKIEVHEGHYRIFFNGEELRRRFPLRIDIRKADHVTLLGGSNGFKWSALKLPNNKTAPGTEAPFSTTKEKKNFLDRPLAVGDKLKAWGIYATGSVKFSVNLMMEEDFHFMMHVDFRPPPNENKVVLNSRKKYGWETEIRTPIPRFENGKVFSVTVVCLEEEFEVYHDNQVLGAKFPYRDGFRLEDVKFVWLLGGSRGMMWTDLAISQPRPDLNTPGSGTKIFTEVTDTLTTKSEIFTEERTETTEGITTETTTYRPYSGVTIDFGSDGSETKIFTEVTDTLTTKSETFTEERTETTEGAPPPRPSCKGDEFTCKERCIPSTWRCDGETDCWKGEDEKECDKKEIKPF